MTERLKQAFEEASKLSQEEQDALAEVLLADLAAETKWSQLFGGSEEKLGQLGEEALNDFRKGKTRPFDERDLTGH
jgi:hypothetical protein